MEQTKPRKKSILRRIIKIVGWIAASIILLLIFVVILIQIPAVQNFGRKKIVAFLEKKIGTKVEIKHLDIDFPKMIVLEGVYFEDQQKDTLLSGNKLKVDISLFKLLKNTVEINEIALDGITAHIGRTKEGQFNFDYIINAFAGEQTKPEPPKDSTAGMKFSIDEINLDKINLKYHDDYMGYDVVFGLTHFDTDINTFDLDNFKFAISDITLNGIDAKIRQYKPLATVTPAPDTTITPAAASKPLDLKLNDINITKVNVDYQNEIDSLFAVLNLGKLHIDPDKIDMAGQNITLNELVLANTTANIRLGKKAAAQQVAEKIATATDSVATVVEQQGWKLAVKAINLKNNNFKFDNDASPALAKGMDYSHLDIKDLNLKVDNLHFQPDSIAASVKGLQLTDKSGVKVNQLKTDFAYTDKQAYLKNLYLETPDTKLQRSISLRYPSIESLSKNINALQINADLTGTTIAFKDLLYFVPTLATQDVFAKNPDGKLRADVVVRGAVNNLQIQKFDAAMLNRTHVNISGRVSGLPDVDKAFADLTITDISTSDADIYSLMPKGSLPSNISIPARIVLSGSLKGSMQQLATNLGLKTSYGNVGLKGTIANPTDSIRAKYNLDLAVNNFDVGKLIKQDTVVGVVNLAANVMGTGYAPSKMNADLKGVVHSAEVKGYTYKDLSFSGKGTKGIFDITADINDPNINLNLTAHADLNGAAPAIQADLMVDSISLKPLHFSSSEMKIHTKISADIPQLDMDKLIGDIMITELLLADSAKRYVLDTIRIAATNKDSINSIALFSPIAHANLTGKYTLSGIGGAITDIINRYYTIATSATPQPSKETKLEIKQPAPPQDAAFNITVFNSPVLKELVPDLFLTDSIRLAGNINSQTSTITMGGFIPRLRYGTNQIGKAQLRLRTLDSALVYELDIDQFNSPSFNVPFASLTGSVANNQLGFNLSVVDNKLDERFLLAGCLRQDNDNFQLSLLPDGVKLDYDQWKVPSGNKIMFGKDGIRADSFILSNTDQSLAIQSTEPGNNSPIEVKFNNFKIESITKIAEKDSLYLGGTINGNTVVSELNTSPLFIADLLVKDFNFKKDTVGDISIKVDNKVANTYAANVSVKGKNNGNSLLVTGNYYANENASFDFDVNLERIDLATVESFTAGSLKQMAGHIEGKMKVTGTPTTPKVIGDLNFKQAAMNVSMLNSLFTMQDERISFKSDGIHFDDFTISDSAKNSAIISGAIYTTNYQDFRFNVDLDADDFMVLNSQKKDNPLYYGKLFIDTKVKVRGDLDNPQVNADLTVNPKTKLTLVLPQSDPQVAAREGIVEFFDQDHQDLDSMLLARYDSLNESEIKGMDVVANLTIAKEAEFNVVIDEANGDFVNISGEGNLSGGIDPSGKITLTGTYEIDKGSYDMSFSLLKRKFSIQQGSIITFTGEPTSAEVDITAVYVSKTAPINLVEQQLSSTTNKNLYKQNLPFNVLLKMKGELLKPELSFDIVLPEGNYNVSTEVLNTTNGKLAQIRQQDGELNKQVFALLLLNRFISENPFSNSSGSTSATTMAKQSVSKILAEQLNNLAADLVTGVELNFGLETTNDYSSGNQQDRTELNVGVSKQLLNDRLKVSVGSNFELEGPQQANQKTSNIAGNVQIDYKLSKDGTYTLRGYRVDQYEVALQGQVIETGVTFIISLDYDKFSEIFQRRRLDKATRKKQKEDEKKDKAEKELQEKADTQQP